MEVLGEEVVHKDLLVRVEQEILRQLVHHKVVMVEVMAHRYLLTLLVVAVVQAQLAKVVVQLHLVQGVMVLPLAFLELL